MKRILFAVITIAASTSFGAETNVQKYLSVLKKYQAKETTAKHSDVRTFTGISAVNDSGNRIANSSCKLEVVGDKLVLSMKSAKGISAISVSTEKTEVVNETDAKGLTSAEITTKDGVKTTKAIGIIKHISGTLGVLANVMNDYQYNSDNTLEQNEKIAEVVRGQDFTVACELK